MNLKKIALLTAGMLPLGIIAQPGPPPTTIRPNLSINSQPGISVKPATAPPTAEMPSKSNLSYAIGMYFGNNITNSVKRGDLEVDNDVLIAAIKDVLAGKPRMTEPQLKMVLNQLRAAMMAKREEGDREAKIKGDTWLAQFAKSPGVTTLPNGLEYKVIKDGSGPMPKENDSVTVAYRGTLIDGTEFDHNDNFPTPIKGRVIQGWQKILPLMKVGSKWQVAIPSGLGYGPRGYPPKIPGNSVLIFDMELKSVTSGGPSFPPTGPTPPSASQIKPGSAPQTVQVSGDIIKVPSQEDLKKGAKIEVIKAGQTNVVPANTASSH